jgi:putative membrane protein
MIVKPQQTWYQSLICYRGTALGESIPRMALTTVVASIITTSEHYFGVGSLDLTPVPFSLTGVAIGIFLGFRGKTAYDRFWEGRTLWGGLINNCRTLARQILTVLKCPDDPDGQFRKLQTKCIYLLIAFAHALRNHLRDSQPWDDLAPLVDSKDLEALRSQRNVPMAITQLLSEELATARERGWLHELHVPITDRIVCELTNIQGGCERIKNTPVPYAYGVLSHRVVAIFCLFLPLGIVDTVKSFTPFVTLLVSYAFFGLDSLGAEIEEPFGTDPHDLPLDAMCRTIEVNLRQLLGETNLPEMMVPVDYVLT